MTKRSRLIARAICLIASVGVTGCSASKIATPDPRNPAHCLAAFNYARYWLAKGSGPSDLKAELSAEAMAYFTAAKLKKAGAWASAFEEGKSLTKSFGAQSDQMDALYSACGHALEADREFMANQTSWMRIARLKNEHCKQEPTCRVAE